MKWLLSFLLCFSASAQLPIFSYQIPSSLVTPGTLNPTYWWVGDDRSNVGNGNTITNWVDRISGNIKTNVSSLEPTYSSSAHGASFNGTTWFSNTVIFNGSSPFNVTNTLVVVFAPTTPATTGGLICTDDSGGHGPVFVTATQIRPFATGSTPVYNYQSGVPYIFTTRWTNNVNVVYFTNNVKISVVANALYGPGSIRFVGQDGEASPLRYKGTLVEEVWYNYPLTDDQITNTLYQYYRSTYPSLFP